MQQKPFSFPSATGVGTIAANAYLPDGAPDAVLAIHHGMAEHQERYEPFIRFLCDHGIGVYMHDMASHGQSTDSSPTGWFGEKDGWKNLIEDFRTVVTCAKEENPGKKVFVMGHSMGSFICRLYTAKYPEDGFAGAIYMGTGGSNPAAGAGMAMANGIGAIRGKQHKSPMLARMAFSSYNKGLERRTEYDWLTRDTEIVDRYIADPLCGFLFTAQGMNDLIHATAAANSREWYESVPKDLPILLVSGEKDPVGGWGKGVSEVDTRLKETGHTRVTKILYPECRHEVLNELNRGEVMEDILAWLVKADKEE